LAGLSGPFAHPLWDSGAGRPWGTTPGAVKPPPVRSVTRCGCGQAIISAGALAGEQGTAQCLRA
jgi:hypothetical protein